MFPISFGYKSKLKDYVSTDAYTGKEVARENRTVEHILPHCNGGKNIESNYLMVDKDINNLRGNIPFDKWLKAYPEFIKNIQNYLNKLRGIKINNKDYVKEVIPTLNKEAKGLITFKGNKKIDINI